MAGIDSVTTNNIPSTSSTSGPAQTSKPNALNLSKSNSSPSVHTPQSGESMTSAPTSDTKLKLEPGNKPAETKSTAVDGDRKAQHGKAVDMLMKLGPKIDKLLHETDKDHKLSKEIGSVIKDYFSGRATAQQSAQRLGEFEGKISDPNLGVLWTDAYLHMREVN